MEPFTAAAACPPGGGGNAGMPHHDLSSLAEFSKMGFVSSWIKAVDD